MAKFPDGWVFTTRIEGPKKKDGQLVVTVSVDRKELVMCKHCKYGEPDTNGLGEDMVMCTNSQNPIGFGGWLMPPEWYCADGEEEDKHEDQEADAE